MSIIQLELNDVACTGCIGKIKRGIKKYHGVDKVKILAGRSRIVAMSFCEPRS